MYTVVFVIQKKKKKTNSKIYLESSIENYLKTTCSCSNFVKTKVFLQQSCIIN